MKPTAFDNPLWVYDFCLGAEKLWSNGYVIHSKRKATVEGKDYTLYITFQCNPTMSKLHIICRLLLSDYVIFDCTFEYFKYPEFATKIVNDLNTSYLKDEYSHVYISEVNPEMAELVDQVIMIMALKGET